MKRRIVSALLTLALSVPCVAQAKTVEFTIGDKTMNTATDYIIESQELLAAPFIANDRTMVPVRAVSESFGAKVTWVPETRNIFIQSKDKSITLTVDSAEAQVNGEKVILDAAPTIVGDITFVPVRFVTESMGYYVYFASSTSSVLVGDTPPVGYVNGVPLSREEYAALYLLLSQNNPPDPETAVASYLVQCTILSDEAKKAGIVLSEEELEALRNKNNYPGLLRGQLALILEKEVLAFNLVDALKEQASENETVKKAYQETYLCAKHVLISYESEQAEKTAKDVYRYAKAGTKFDQLIEDFGEDPGMEQNPDGYVFTDGEMVAPFENAVKALPVGGISQPVESDFGYHVIMRMPLPEEIPEEILTGLVWNLKVVPLIESAEITETK
ncbi:MAG: peptidylprolyl isomerase [Clostridia bacterium]|nr:peptidylprolyl isomerase [Clostridia bacterium]